MKRKLDKNKVYAFIGQAIVYTSIWAISVIGTAWAFTQNTIY